MQLLHDLELLIDGLTAPRRVYWDSQGRVLSLPWEAKDFDSLELPDLSSYSDPRITGRKDVSEVSVCVK